MLANDGEAASRNFAVGKCKGMAKCLNKTMCLRRNLIVLTEKVSCAKNGTVSGLLFFGIVKLRKVMAWASRYQC